MLLFGKKAESGVAGARRALLENVNLFFKSNTQKKKNIFKKFIFKK